MDEQQWHEFDDSLRSSDIDYEGSIVVHLSPTLYHNLRRYMEQMLYE